MKKFFKELFCNHVWKNISDEEYLRTETYKTQIFCKETYEFYSRKQRCLRCGKERVIQKRYFIV